MPCTACAQVEPFRKVTVERRVLFSDLWRSVWGACE